MTAASGLRLGRIRIGPTEVRDLAIAWAALGVAFTMFIGRPAILERPTDAVTLFLLCLATAGVGFIGHELAHKLTALHLGRPAVFEADYGLLFLTVMSGIVGFLFAAPGAVVHRGRPNRRKEGLVAVAGPVSNLGLMILFVPLALVPVSTVATIGLFGIWINALLAAFNMLPFGPLDGRTVWRWHKLVFGAVFVPSLASAFLVFRWVGLLPV